MKVRHIVNWNLQQSKGAHSFYFCISNILLCFSNFAFHMFGLLLFSLLDLPLPFLVSVSYTFTLAIALKKFLHFMCLDMDTCNFAHSYFCPPHVSMVRVTAAK